MNSTARSLGFPTTDDLRFLPEGPVPLSQDGTFSWVGIQHGADAKHGSLNIFDLSTNTNQSFVLPGRPGFAFACTTPDTFVVGCERSLGWFHTTSGKWEPFCEGIDVDVENTIVNDGLVHGDNLIFGTKDLEFSTKKAGLYLYRGRDGKLIRLRDDQICSNGKAIIESDDGGLSLIDIDSPTKIVVRYALDIDTATLSDAVPVLDLTDDPAVPDGMILTPDGSGIIVAMFHPGDPEFGETRLYDFDSGQLRRTWKTPGSPQNTCPALVRHDGMIKLVITTAMEHFPVEKRAKHANAGHLFIADTDIPDPGGPLATQYPH